MKLPLRLLTVAEQIICDEPMADIGSDHALLPCYLVAKGICPWAICGELGDGPFGRTLQAVGDSGLSHLIQVRQGNGLEVLEPDEVATVVLAGMGGNNIIEILKKSITQTISYRRLVLQPMNALPEVRYMASTLGWKIEKETVIKDGDYYLNLVLNPQGGIPYLLSQRELRWGPCLIDNCGDPEVMGYFRYHLEKSQQIAAGIPSESSPRSLRQKQALHEIIKELEEMLRWR